MEKKIAHHLFPPLKKKGEIIAESPDQSIRGLRSWLTLGDHMVESPDFTNMEKPSQNYW